MQAATRPVVSKLSRGSRRLAGLSRGAVTGLLPAFLPTPVINTQFERADGKRQEWKVGLTHLWEGFVLGFLRIKPGVFSISPEVAGNEHLFQVSRPRLGWLYGSCTIGTKKKNHGKRWLVKLTRIVYCLQFTNRGREADTNRQKIEILFLVELTVWTFSVTSDPLRPHGLEPTTHLNPWDFPGMNTGVGRVRSSRGSSQLSNWTCVSLVSCIAGRFFTHWAIREGLYRGNQVKMRSLWWALFLCGWWGKCEQIETGMEGRQPSASQGELSGIDHFLRINSLQEEPALLIPWSQTSRLQNFETINVCCFSHAVYSTF